MDDFTSKHSNKEADDSATEEKIKKHIETLLKTTKSEEHIDTLQKIKSEIINTSKSMTTIPEPLKFLHTFYDDLITHYNTSSLSGKNLLADIISCLSMINKTSNGCLEYYFKGSNKNLDLWGHEYVRHLSREISIEYSKRIIDNKPIDDLIPLIKRIFLFNIKHRAETEACDLLIEVDQLNLLNELVNEDSCSRICIYLDKCTDYLVDSEEINNNLLIIHNLYIKYGHLVDALLIAIKLNKIDLIISSFSYCKDNITKKQFATIIGSQKISLNIFEDETELRELLGNSHYNEHFSYLIKELDVGKPKSLDEIYKSNLIDTQSYKKNNQSGKIDLQKETLSSTLVNGLVHTAYCNDLLMTVDENNWIYKNKDHYIISGVATLGLIHLWDLENGFAVIDNYSLSNDKNIIYGVILATGIVSCGITSEMDATHALLCDHLESEDPNIKLYATVAFGLAFVGSAREDLSELLCPILLDNDIKSERSSFAALSLGLIFQGTCDNQICGNIIEALIYRSNDMFDEHNGLIMCLGLGLLFFGSGDNSEAILEVLSVVPKPYYDIAKVLVTICAYGTSGSVLQLQSMIQNIDEYDKYNEELDDKDKESLSCVKKGILDVQPLSVIGIALNSIGDKLGIKLCYRIFDNFLRYENYNVKRAVPLALALMYVSNPEFSIVETLSKLTHDSDEPLSSNAILALGLVGAGTNNSRIAKMLRNLTVYYEKEPNHLFITRLSQGLVHLGKGLLTINPHFYDNKCISKASLSGILVLMVASLHMKDTILGKMHFMIYYIVCSIRPKMLITLDTNFKPLPVDVRVGQSVETVKQAGEKNKITGFQTHSTPVLLGAGEKAELATDKYISLTPVLEGIVILKLNPKYKEEEKGEMKD